MYAKHFFASVAFGFFATLLMAAIASCEESVYAPMRKPLTVLAIAGATDVTSTFTSRSNFEQNPVVSWMQPHMSLKTTVAAGAALETLAVLAACHFICERRPRLARTLIYVGAAAHFGFAVDNWRRGTKR